MANKQLIMTQEVLQKKGRDWEQINIIKARGIKAYEQLTWLLTQTTANSQYARYGKHGSQLVITMDCLPIPNHPNIRYRFTFRGGNVEALFN